MRRKIQFANEEFYHCFNRGVDKREIYSCNDDYERFVTALYLLNSEEDGLMLRWRDFKKANPRAKLLEFQELRSRKKIVDVVCYCLNHNHYHLLLKQVKDFGIEIFMHRLGTSHSNFYNKKYDRTGSLFQGPYKSVHVSTNEQLLYLSAYINMNHIIHGYEPFNSKSQALGNWDYCSMSDYLGKRNASLCDTEPILGQFKDMAEYRKYAKENALYMKEKKEMERYILE